MWQSMFLCVYRCKRAPYLKTAAPLDLMHKLCCLHDDVKQWTWNHCNLLSPLQSSVCRHVCWSSSLTEKPGRMQPAHPSHWDHSVPIHSMEGDKSTQFSLVVTSNSWLTQRVYYNHCVYMLRMCMQTARQLTATDLVYICIFIANLHTDQYFVKSSASVTCMCGCLPAALQGPPRPQRQWKMSRFPFHAWRERACHSVATLIY